MSRGLYPIIHTYLMDWAMLLFLGSALAEEQPPSNELSGKILRLDTAHCRLQIRSMRLNYLRPL